MKTSELPGKETLLVEGIRPWKHRTRKWGETIDDGAFSVLVEVLGCNLLCAHCYVSDDLLKGRRDSPELQKKLELLPRNLQTMPQKVEDIFEYANSLFSVYHGPRRALELTSGEPTLSNPKGVQALAGLCEENNLVLGINTNGTRLSTKYLQQLSEYNHTVQFLVSLRTLGDDSFLRFTGIVSKEKDIFKLPFQSAQRVVQAGFPQPWLGVTLDTIADTPAQVPQKLNLLYSLVEEFGLDTKRLIWDTIQYKNHSGQDLPTVARMASRNYNRTTTDQVRDAAIAYLVSKHGVKRDQIK